MARGRPPLPGAVFPMRVIQAAARQVAGRIGRDSWLVRRLRPAYASALEWSSHGRGLPMRINGVEYRVDPHHRHRMACEYEAPVAALLRERVKAGALCFDVGANVGVYVLQFAHWSAPTGRIVAFEPNPEARQVLEKHVRLNGLVERVSIVPHALSARTGTAVLHMSGADGMSRLGAPNSALADRTSAIEVSTTSLDEFCQANGMAPDWLFIDIEGVEIQALKGGRELILDRRGKLGIVIEMHPNAWASAGTRRSDAEALLSELGLRAVPLTGQSDPLRDHGMVVLEPR